MCCNRPRQVIPNTTRVVRSSALKPQARLEAAPVQGSVGLRKPVFEYVGAAALTVVSPVTRKTYRFEKTGTRVEVDVRDRSWMAIVPNLVPVG